MRPAGVGRQVVEAGRAGNGVERQQRLVAPSFSETQAMSRPPTTIPPESCSAMPPMPRRFGTAVETLPARSSRKHAAVEHVAEIEAAGRVPDRSLDQAIAGGHSFHGPILHARRREGYTGPIGTWLAAGCAASCGEDRRQRVGLVMANGCVVAERCGGEKADMACTSWSTPASLDREAVGGLDRADMAVGLVEPAGDRDALVLADHRDHQVAVQFWRTGAGCARRCPGRACRIRRATRR